MDPENQLAANYARKAAENTAGDDYLKLSSLMCWDAVKHCALKAGIIDQTRYNRISGKSDMVGGASAVLARPQTIASLQPGQILGFYFVEDGQERMMHCMLSVGQGKAAGNKNDCMGIGRAVGWEVLDLGGLRWDGDQLTCPRGAASSNPGVMVYRNVICRYNCISYLRFR